MAKRKNVLSFSESMVTVHNYVGDEVATIQNDDGTMIMVASCGGDCFTLDELRGIVAKMEELEKTQ
jgi:hypothetical protein